MTHNWLGLHGSTSTPLRLQDRIDEQTTFPLLQEEQGRGQIGSGSRHDVFVYDATGAETLHIDNQHGSRIANAGAVLKTKLREALQTK